MKQGKLRKYRATSVIIEEGGYKTLFQDLSDAKRFFAGEGRVIQLKNVNATGMSWVGIEVIMFVNNLHEYMCPYSFNPAL